MKRVAAVRSSAQQNHPKRVKVRFELLSSLAREVCLAGDFNQWKPRELRLKHTNGAKWEIEVMLSPGTHEYLFVVDGEWEPDPEADTVSNSFGTKHSVIHVDSARETTKRTARKRVNSTTRRSQRNLS